MENEYKNKNYSVGDGGPQYKKDMQREEKNSKKIAKEFRENTTHPKTCMKDL